MFAIERSNGLIKKRKNEERNTIENSNSSDTLYS
jgi:hypothetical protein